jgi:hypothetical protein
MWLASSALRLMGERLTEQMILVLDSRHVINAACRS